MTTLPAGRCGICMEILTYEQLKRNVQILCGACGQIFHVGCLPKPVDNWITAQRDDALARRVSLDENSLYTCDNCSESTGLTIRTALDTVDHGYDAPPLAREPEVTPPVRYCAKNTPIDVCYGSFNSNTNTRKSMTS